jgi:hypothetical protein
MNKIAKLFPLLVMATFVLVQGCNQTTKIQNDYASSFIVPAAADLKLLSLEKIDKGSCTRFGVEPYAEDNIKRITEPHWPNINGGAHQFIDKNAQHLAYALTTSNDTDREFASRLLKAANSDAYTVLDFEGQGGGSPSFLTAVLIKSVSYSVSYLDAEQALTDSERNIIYNWVQKLAGNVYERESSPDHRAAIATSFIMAGAAFKNEELFKSGLAKYLRSLSQLRSGLAFSRQVRISNEVMHHMLPGAEVLLLNGIDVFKIKFDKDTLHDTIEHHANQVIKTGRNKVNTGHGVDKARSIMRAQGFGTHLAWIPIYLNTFPHTKAAASVVALDNLLRKSDGKDYYGTQLGIHSGCLFKM